MTKIGVPGLPAKTGTILDAGYLHLNESSVDKKVTIAQLLAKIEDQYSADIVTFLGSANKAEGRANLSIDRRITVDNADYAILATDKVVAQTGIMSATRTFSLPVASTVQAGAEITIIDESGSVDSSNKIIIQRSGTDTIDGLTQKEILIPYGNLRLLCNGVNGWKIVDNNKSTSLSLGVSYLSKPIEIKNNATDTNNDIDFSTGNFVFDDYLGQASFLALTKQLDANWGTGNNAGGLDTGTKSNSTWYYCYVIYNPVTGVSDALFTATYSSPTMPSGYTKKSYRGAIKTDASGNILPFFYRKNRWFDWGGIGQILDYSASKAVNTTTPNIPISAPPYSMARLLVKIYGPNASPVLLNAADQTISIADTASSSSSPIGNLGDQSNSDADVAYANLEIFTGANSQIQFGTGNFSTSATISILTKGWIDNNIIY